MAAHFSILVLAEDEATRQLLADVLALDYEVCSAEDALQALNLLARQFDLLIVDLPVPADAGMSFIRTVRGTPRTVRIPILALGDSEAHQQAVAGQVQGFLSKPFTLDQLTRTVAGLICSH
jgi:CheY-like chemotaxis protein